MTSIYVPVMCNLYLSQNKWMNEVKTIQRSCYMNIDKKHELGLALPVSLSQFIREQPMDPNFTQPMDIENGGPTGKPMIIIMLHWIKAAQNAFEDLQQLTKGDVTHNAALADLTHTETRARNVH